jgi:hypothetical protein
VKDRKESKPTQRDLMRSIYRTFCTDHRRVVTEYANTEKNGMVTRTKNTHDLNPEQYAKMLLADGLRKGWLRA